MSLPAPAATAAYRLCCHACATEQPGEGICGACGPARFYYRLADDGAQVQRVCGQCNAPAADLKVSAPDSCSACASPDLGWRDPASLQWRPETLPVLPGEGPWVCGDFDADCHWQAAADYRRLGSETGDLLANSLPLGGIVRAQLENVTLIDGPPLLRTDADTRPPVRLDSVPDVYVYREQDNELRLYQVTLTDFRLHDWQQTLQPDIGEEGTLGRLQGKAYARLALKPEQRPRTRPAQGVRQLLSRALPSEEENKSAIAAEGEHCNTCNLFLMAVVFLLLYLACGWLTALAGVAVMTLQCRWRSVRMRDGRNKMPRVVEIAVGLLLLVAAVLLYLFMRDPACDGRSVFWWLAGIALALVLTALLRRCWPWLLITLVWVLALLAYFCGTQPECALSSPTMPSMSAPAADAGEPPAAEAEPVAVDAAAAPAEAGGNWPWPSLPRFNPLPSIGNAADKLRDGVEQLLAHDLDAQRVEDQATGNGRVSVDQALRRPDRYFSCDPRKPGDAAQSAEGARAPRQYSIYLGEAALFDKDSATLGPGAEAHLRKLARLLERRPDARLVLTGHADSSGQREHNLMLSQRRASAVAEWLVANAGLPADRIETRAAGDRQPLVDEPTLYRLNRRVEVTLDCSGKAAS